MKQYGRFTQTALKDRGKVQYDESILQQFKVNLKEEETYDRIYFPFFIDKQHWVGICLDLHVHTVYVLDCTLVSARRARLKKTSTQSRS